MDTNISNDSSEKIQSEENNEMDLSEMLRKWIEEIDGEGQEDLIHEDEHNCNIGFSFDLTKIEPEDIGNDHINIMEQDSIKK